MIKDILNRIKNLKEFHVEMDLPEDFRFSGRVPFDMFIEDGKVTATILAASEDEAHNALWEYLYK